MRAGAIEPEAERRQLHPTLRMLLRGLRRFVLMTAIAAGIAVGLGLVAGWLSDADLGRYAALGLYVGGGILVLFGVVTYSSQPRRWVGELGEDLGPGADPGETAALVLVGAGLIGLGMLLETFA